MGMKTFKATITQSEMQMFKTEYALTHLLGSKGLQIKGSFSPKLIGKVTKVHNVSDMSWVFTQEVEDEVVSQ